MTKLILGVLKVYTITSVKTMLVVAWKAVTVNMTNRFDFDNINEDIDRNDVKLDSLVLSICVHYELSKLQLESITSISKIDLHQFATDDSRCKIQANYKGRHQTKS